MALKYESKTKENQKNGLITLMPLLMAEMLTIS